MPKVKKSYLKNAIYGLSSSLSINQSDEKQRGKEKLERIKLSFSLSLSCLLVNKVNLVQFPFSFLHSCSHLRLKYMQQN